MNYTQFKLRDLLTIKNGKDYKTEKKGQIPVYGTGGIIAHVDNYLYDGESILLPRKGSLQNIEYVSGKFWTVDTIYWSEINKEVVYPKYLYLYLSLLDLSHLDSGSTLPSMTFNSYYEIVVCLPDIEKQRKIADFIFYFIDVIKNKKKQIETLESIAKTIYSYWFVQFDFPNEEGKPYKSSGGKMVWNEELKREIPEGWDCVQLSEVFSFIKGKLPEKLSVIKSESLETYITIDVANGGNPLYCSPQKMISCDSETIMVMDGAASGDVYVGLKGILGSTFSKIDLKRSDISNSFIYLLLSSLKKGYVRANTGSTVPHANSQYIGQLKVSIPKNCSVLSKEIDVIYEKISLLKEQLTELNSLKTFLLPLLFNGQVSIE